MINGADEEKGVGGFELVERRVSHRLVKREHQKEIERERVDRVAEA